MNDSYTKKDFRVDWFSGTGPGGQKRNKTQNCVRITHLPTGLRATSTRHKERPSNLRDAFNRLAGLILAAQEPEAEGRRTDNAVVRTYHFERNDVIDHGSGLVRRIAPVMDGDLTEFRESAERFPLPRTGRV